MDDSPPFPSAKTSAVQRTRVVRAHAALVLLAATVAAGLLLATTQRWGLGVSYDSVVYVQASHSLSRIPLPQAQNDAGKALYFWAPGYPLALKAFGGSYSGARLLNALLLFAGVLVVAISAWRAIEARTGAIAAVLYACSPAVFSTHLQLLAEPLFLFLVTVALALMSEGRATSAGFAAGAAALTRYAGLPLIVVGAVFLRGRRRIAFLVPSTGLYLGWIARNELAAGQATGRHLRWHPQSWDTLAGGLRAGAHLLVTSGRLPSIHLHFAGLAAEGIAFGALVIGLLRTGWTKPPRLVTVGLVYAGVYCVFLVVTAFLFDALTPFDERLLAPLLPPLLVAVAWVLRDQRVVAATLSAVFMLVVVQQAHTFSIYGSDYSGRIWSRARIAGASLPPGDLVATWPGAIAYFTGRSPRRFPNPKDEHTGAATPGYARQWSQLEAAVRTGRLTVITFDNSFLEIPETEPPITSRPGFEGTCHPLTEIVSICSNRAAHA